MLLLLAIIVSQQLWLWTVVRPDTPADALVLYALSTLNFVAFVVFLFIFARNLLKLRRERRERQLGSKVKTRLLVYFISISFLPITAMAFFSYLFLNRSLEKWFNPFPDEIVQQATEVKRLTLSSQDQTLRDTASLLVMLLNGQSGRTAIKNKGTDSSLCPCEFQLAVLFDSCPVESLRKLRSIWIRNLHRSRRVYYVGQNDPIHQIG